MLIKAASASSGSSDPHLATAVSPAEHLRRAVVISRFDQPDGFSGTGGTGCLVELFIAAQPPDILVQFVARRLNRLRFGEQGAALFVQFNDRIDARRGAGIVELEDLLLDPFRLLPDQGDVEHG